MKYRLAIFDMDGTILDTLDDLRDSLNYVLYKNNYPQRTQAEVRSFVGNGIKKLIERAVPKEVSQEEIEKLFNEFIPYYKKNCFHKTKPYDGINELILSLRQRGCLTAVVSNKAHSAVQELCEIYFKDMFDCAIGERSGIRKKPEPDSVYETLNKLNVSKLESVYIGDSEVDIETANNAGMDSIIVSWGFRDKEKLIENGAKIIVSSPKEIETIIFKN